MAWDELFFSFFARARKRGYSEEMWLNIMDMNANFAQLKVPDLQCRGIPILNKRREELLDMSIKAHEFCIEDLGDDQEKQHNDVYNSKLLTKYGTLPDWALLA